MLKQYSIELTGQAEFYKQYLPLVDHTLNMDDLQQNNNDGQLGDLLIEFKLSINDINRVLFQTIKYLSALRIKGKPVPRHILLISLNNGRAYVFDAQNYLKDIEKTYIGGASKNDEGFIAGEPQSIWQYTKEPDQSMMVMLMKHAKNRLDHGTSEWIPVHIDSSDIVGWANTYYNQVPGATKASFLGDKGIIGEIRKPNHLKGMILPYTGPDNDEFAYIMDRLNDNFQKKDLGAFYTPTAYANKSHELVYEAIRRFQKSGNQDYIILDRCAGTGNLEAGLNDHVPDDILDKNVLSHVIVNTYEFYEYKVLMARLGDKVRYIIPPTTEFTDGTVNGSNALSEDFLKHPVIQKYLKDSQVTVIIYENPPFAETTSMDHQKKGKGKSSGLWKKNLVVDEAKEELKGAQSNDMSNVFVWSAFHYYLRQPTDSVIIFGPLKYWKKADNWMNYSFIKGFAFNRRWFHTTSDTVVSCILWGNTLSSNEQFDLSVYNLQNDILTDFDKVNVKRIHSLFSQSYYEELNDPSDAVQNNETNEKKAIWGAVNGLEAINKHVRIKAKYNSNIIAYLVTKSSTFELPALKTVLTRLSEYDGNGFHLRKSNYLSKLPMFAAGWWSTYNPKEKWYLNGVVYRSGDGKRTYETDVKNHQLDNWLNQVLFYTCLEYYNKIRSLYGSDNRWYFNELCLDNNKGRVDNPDDKTRSETLAYHQLKQSGFLDHLDVEEKVMLALWNKILQEAQTTKKYNAKYNYDIFQISKELNTKHKETTPNGREVNVYDYPDLNGDLKSMRQLVKQYYHSHIQDNLFKYEFLK